MPKIVKDEDVYRAVMQVVSERGYSGATTKQMAEMAKVSEMTIFRKYGNKAELVKAAISFIISQTNFSSAAEYTGNIQADFIKVVQAYQDTAVTHGFFFFALLSEITRYPELVDTLDKPFEIFSSIGNLVVQYQNEGRLRKDHPLNVVAALLGPIIYASMVGKFLPNTEPPPRNLSDYVNAFLKGYEINN